MLVPSLLRWRVSMTTSLPEYRLTPKAKEDLEEIWLYMLETWGVEQANHYIEKLTDTFAALAKEPMRAMTCDHIRQGYRWSPSGRHVIYFRPTDYGIAVIRVLHERMLPERHL